MRHIRSDAFLLLCYFCCVIRTDTLFHAGTYYVSTDGKGNCTSIDQPCTLPYAVATAPTDTTLILLDESYVVQSSLVVKQNLMITSKANVSTSIRCGKSMTNSLFIFGGTSNSAMRDLTFMECSLWNPLAMNQASGTVFVNSSASVQFTRIKFINITVHPPHPSNELMYGGGGVTCYGVCNFYDCNFKNITSRAPYSIGLAVFMNHTVPVSVQFTGCVFSFNRFLSTEGSDITSFGTVYIVLSGQVEFQGCLFQNNLSLRTGSISGVALYVESTLPPKGPPHITIDGCTFFNNTINGGPTILSGSAIHTEQVDTVIIRNSNFTQNLITCQTELDPCIGGALAVHNCRVLQITGCRFIANGIEAFGVGSTSSGEGGAIAFGGGEAVITNSLFSRNFLRQLTSASGGAIYSTGRLRVINNTFQDNEATVHPGTVYEGLFPGSALGGAIYCSEPLVSIGNVYQRNKVVAGDSDGGAGGLGGGGAVCWNAWSTSSFQLDHFMENVARGGEGVLQIANQLGGAGAGGALYMKEEEPGPYHTDIEGCVFTNNKAIGGNSTFGGSALPGGRALGGAIYANTTLTRIRSTFLANNSAIGGWPDQETLAMGGGMFVLGNVDIHGSILSGNIASGGVAMGGAIVGGFNATNTTFSRNQALGKSWSLGGAVSGSDLMLSSCIFAHNVAVAMDVLGNNSVGGAIYSELSSSHDIGCLEEPTLFHNNSAAYGGAIFFDGIITGGELLFGVPPTFDSNLAGVAGGALFAIFDNTTFPHTHLCGAGCNFWNNNSTHYGPDMASNDKRVKFKQAGNILKVWPGATFGVTLLLSDYYNQTVIRQDINLGVSYSPQNHTHFLSGVPKDIVSPDNNGLYHFSEMDVTGEPGHSFPITFKSIPSDLASSTSLTATVWVLQCPPSYLPPTKADKLSTCTPCPFATYTFSPLNPDGCLACPVLNGTIVNCVSTYTTASMATQPSFNVTTGFWPDSFLNPAHLFACPSGRCIAPFTCDLVAPAIISLPWSVDCHCINPDQDPLSCVCSAGSYDFLCSRCRTGWFYIHPNICEQCTSEHAVTTVFVIVIGVILLLLFFGLKGNGSLFFVCGSLALMLLSMLGVGSMWLVEVMLVLVFLFMISSGGIPSGGVKSLLFFLQVLDSMFSNQPALWPGWVKDMMRSFNWINFRLSDVSCLDIDWLQPPIGDFAFFMFLPFLLILSASLLLCIRFFVQKYVVHYVWDIVAALVLFKESEHQADEKDDASSKNEEERIARDIQNESEIVNEEEGGMDAVVMQRESGYEAISMTGDSEDEDDFYLMPWHRQLRDGDDEQHTIVTTTEDRLTSISKDSSLHHLGSRIMATALFLLYTLHFRLTGIVFDKLKPCNNGNHMAQFQWIPCDFRSYHLTLVIMATVFLVLFVCGIPALMGYLLYRNRMAIRTGRARSSITEECIGFLYGCFLPHLFWFEMIWLARRLMLAAALNLVPSDNPLRPLLVLSVLAIALAVHCYLKPLKDAFENLLEGVGMLGLLITFATGLIVSSSTVFSPSDFTQPILTAIMVANLLIFCLFLMLLVKPASEKFFKKFKNKFRLITK